MINSNKDSLFIVTAVGFRSYLPRINSFAVFLPHAIYNTLFFLLIEVFSAKRKNHTLSTSPFFLTAGRLQVDFVGQKHTLPFPVFW
jgi:hypothetical protein